MSLTDEEVYDVIIVGAGPCGLATAARLREQTPAALFTDEEHRRYHWINKHGNRVSLKNVRNGKASCCEPSGREYKMLVVDATEDKWMSRWNHLFKTYEISHLRSPMLWHVDPLDRDSLLAHTYEQQRQGELVEIKNCVGREVSKHMKKKGAAHNKPCGGKQTARVAINLREHNDYYTPSQALFCDHCQHVVERYHLESDLIVKESLENLDYGVVRGVSAEDEKLFTVSTQQGRRYARAVVLAVGAANVPKLPSITKQTNLNTPMPQACHSMKITQFPDPIVSQRLAAGSAANVLVVGGGLTSAQLSDLAVRRGVTRVWHIMRGPCRVKPFDVDLQWMGKYKNAEQARFWSADSDDERLDIIKAARGGGSITPIYNKIMKKHVSSGKVKLHCNTRIVDARFGEVDGRSAWTIQTDPPIKEMPPIDYIYFATGVQTDFSSLTYLQQMLQKYPIEGKGGFPCLNDDLMWKDDVPLFMVGRLSSLKIGPASPNLGGAKIGAERVAWAMDDLSRSWHREDVQGPDSEEKHDGGMDRYLSGQGNMYSSLVCE